MLEELSVKSQFKTSERRLVHIYLIACSAFKCIHVIMLSNEFFTTQGNGYSIKLNIY